MTEDDVKVLVGNRVRHARSRRGLSLRALAAKVGMSPASLSKFERGKHEPQMATVFRIAQGLGVSLAYLVRGIR